VGGVCLSVETADLNDPPNAEVKFSEALGSGRAQSGAYGGTLQSDFIYVFQESFIVLKEILPSAGAGEFPDSSTEIQ
jgi:hypothetical protein